MTGQSLSIVVPVYNSAAILPEFVKRLEAVLERLGRPYELLFVDDNSKDESWRVIERITRESRWVSGTRLMRNYGQHNALLCGIQRARHELVVTMDDDLQHPPEEIPQLLAKLDEGFDVVYGTPQAEQHGFLRDVASRFTKLALQSAMGAATARKVSAFRVFRTYLRDSFEGYRGQFVSIDVLLTWGTTRFAHTRVRHDPRKLGTSGYTLRKLVAHGLNMATGFSTLPLQLASLVGFVFTVFGLLILAYVLVNYISNGPNNVPGFAFVASMIAIFSGAQLFALGIIGEYLARMHFRAMDRPTYLIRERTDDEQPD